MKAKRLFLLPLLLYASVSLAQTKQPVTSFINPQTLPAPHGYSQAAVIDLGNCKMVMISGQVALDTQGNLVGKDNFEQQADQIFKNIKNVVEAAGGNMNDLIKIGYYVLDISQLNALRSVRDRYANVKTPPASTLVQVSKLYRNDVLLEVDAVAVIAK